MVVHLRKDAPWPIGFGGDQDADASAFTRFGYENTSPESVALHLGYTGIYPHIVNHIADPKNILHSSDPFVYDWEGLVNANDHGK